ncbi:transposable element gene [Prunus dulcis]|uniref:Transposable element protein n=1 Tax=Prunus dulcis TaxID=3755 RepID=A0A4Y1RAH9_PRUDU|nr:transposable element gene [Prunus dulcis]
MKEILPLLKSRNLMSFVNSVVVAPSPFLQDDKGKLTDDINPAYDTWIQQDQLVLSWINGSLSSTVLATVARFTSARSTWVALENRFASPNQNRILQLRSELFRTARGDSSLLITWTRSMLLLTISRYLARETPITYADLEALLLSAEQRHLALHAPARDGPATAMVAAHGRAPSRGRGRGSGRFFPWHILVVLLHGLVLPLLLDLLGFAALPPLMVLVPGVLGPHPAAAAGFSSPSAPFSSSRIQCQICGRYGHSALDCYNRLNLSYEGRVPTQRLTAMTAQQSSSPRPPNWVVDTGANSHITNDLSNLSLSREYHGHDSVDGVLGGTGLPITHIGSSSLPLNNSIFSLTDILHCPTASCNLLSDSRTGKTLFRGTSNLGLYSLPSSMSSHGHLAYLGVRVDGPTLVENLFSTKIKALQTDGGGEYTSHIFHNFLVTHGIDHRISCPHHPEQNGLAERKHRHIVDTGLTLLAHASMPLPIGLRPCILLCI